VKPVAPNTASGPCATRDNDTVSVVSLRPKERRYAIDVDRDGQIRFEGEGVIAFEGPWKPEHLVLAALAACSVTSLEYHARRDSLSHAASAAAWGVVGPREDGSWGFREIEVRIDAELQPAPDELSSLLARAERGCFVGASLEPRPVYRWTVNGAPAS
jgi:organic hydroperoxide reductase OsmC/OhrA